MPGLTLIACFHLRGDVVHALSGAIQGSPRCRGTRAIDMRDMKLMRLDRGDDRLDATASRLHARHLGKGMRRA